MTKQHNIDMANLYATMGDIIETLSAVETWDLDKCRQWIKDALWERWV